MDLKVIKGLLRTCVCMLVSVGGMMLFLGLLVAVAIMTNNDILLVAVKRTVTDNPMERGISFFIAGTVQNAALILGPILLVSRVWKANITQLGYTSLKEDWKELVTGLLLGMSAMTFIMFMLVLSGSVKFESISGKNTIAILFSLIGYIMVGIGEETLFRGGLMFALKKTEKPVLILLVQAVIFGLMHIGNNGTTYLALMNLIMFGLFAGFCFYRSGSIWLPIGFHITWNFFQGCVYDFHVSGVVNDGFIKFKEVKTTIFTGESFGPEGGFFATIALVCTLVFAVLRYKKSDFRFI